jgi:hypothetical protein
MESGLFINSNSDLADLISVSLETVAFFFVTVDLYGEERLGRLTVRVSSALDSTSTWIRQYVWVRFLEAYDDISERWTRLASSDNDVRPVLTQKDRSPGSITYHRRDSLHDRQGHRVVERV